MKHFEKYQILFSKQADIYWANLSRTSNLLILLNISLFFVSELVTKHGYYYTYYSLIALCIVKLGELIPSNLLHKLWYYSFFLVLTLISTYFLSTSIIYWVNNSI